MRLVDTGLLAAFMCLSACGKDGSATSPTGGTTPTAAPKTQFAASDLEGGWYGTVSNAPPGKLMTVDLIGRSDGTLTGTLSTLDLNTIVRTTYDVTLSASLDSDGKISGSGTTSYVSGGQLIVAATTASFQLDPNKCRMTGGTLNILSSGLNNLSVSPRVELEGAAFSATARATAVGDGKILQTDNAGMTWTGRVGSATTYFNAVDFADANIGVAVGNNGAILRTTNAGASWVSAPSGVTVDLLGIAFLNGSTGYLVGASGTILKTTNGGQSWTAVTSGTTAQLRGIALLDPGTGIIVGTSGTLLRTTDGGATWSGVSSGTTSQLNGVAFAGSTAIVVGNGGTILKTADGGTTWTPLTSGTTVSLYGVSLLSATAATVAGSSGTILATSDGTTWVPRITNTTATLTAVAFSDSNTGLVVGVGRIFFTSNAGTSWQEPQLLP